MVPPGGRSELLGPLAHFGVQLRFGDRHAFGHDGRSRDHPVSTDVRIKQRAAIGAWLGIQCEDTV